ncbi:ATP-binding protein, partial [Micromonospora zhanjiangensis]
MLPDARPEAAPPAVPTTPAPDNPAGAALGRIVAVFPAVIRVTCGLAGACVALAVRTPPVHVPLLVVTVAVLTGWSLVFTRWTLRHGLTGRLVTVDVTLTVVTCLLMRHLVAAEVLPGEVSWVAILASTSVIVAQLGLPASRSIPTGLLVVGAYALGAHLAGADPEAVANAGTLTVQPFSGAGLTYLARRGSRLADEAFAGFQRVSRQALLDRAAREAERQHNRDLHDTVLSTLTVVGLGAVTAGSAGLRERAHSDLRTLIEAVPSA